MEIKLGKMGLSLVVGIFVQAGHSDPVSGQNMNCINRFISRVCIAGHPQPGETIRTRRCTDAPDVYKEKLAASLAKLPDNMIRMACHVQNVYIESDPEYFPYNGFAWFHDFEDRIREPRGAMVRISQKRFDEYIRGEWTLASLLKAKTLKIFGDGIDAYEIGYESTIDFLDYLMAHEFTHLVDLSNRLNAIADDGCARQFFFGEGMAANCEMEAGSFSNFSWEGTRRPIMIKDGDFGPLLEKYYAGEKLSPVQVFDFVTYLAAKMNFITDYQLSDPFEDLAELTAFYLLTKNNPGAHLDLTVKSAQGREMHWDCATRLTASPLAAQIDYVERVVLSPSIRYPEFAD